MPLGLDFLNQLKHLEVSQRQTNRTIKNLIVDFLNERIAIPSYQRNFVWDTGKQCRFIESIFLNVPIPHIFLLEKREDTRGKKYEVIDGVQRLSTLIAFKEGILRLRGLRKLPELNETTFNSLLEEVRTCFLEDRKLPLIIIEHTTDPEIQFEIFARLNQGALSLNAQELRNCMFHGRFNDFLLEINKKNEYRALLRPFPKFKAASYGKPDKSRMLDVEMILRFFTLYEASQKSPIGQYPAPKKEKLNEYMLQKTHYQDQEGNQSGALDYNLSLHELETMFDRVCAMIRITFAGHQFKRFSLDKGVATFTPFNKGVFDCQMLGFTKYSIADIQDITDLIYEAFLDISSYNREFIAAITKSTDQRINDRMTIWENTLKRVLDNPAPYREKLTLKRKLFDSYPQCICCKRMINSIEESEIDKNQLCHRICYIENRNVSGVSVILNVPVKFKVQGILYESLNVQEALLLFIEILDDLTKRYKENIERICSLNFIGTITALSSQTMVAKKSLKSLGIRNAEEQKLYINVAGTREENLGKMRRIAALYHFLNDFEILS